MKKPKNSNHCAPWPIPFQPLQRVHADYCGPFLNSYYALIIEDAYSKWPEVFLTKNANSEFTKQAFQKFFSREGIPQILLTDNGTHFTAHHLQSWLRSVGCTPLRIAPRHPQSNGIAEVFVRTLKTAIKTTSPSTVQELNSCIDTFLLHYRNATHATTGKAPAQLFKGRILRMNSLDTADVQFHRGNDNRVSDGLMIGKMGTRMFHILDKSDGSVHTRHRDQITISSSHKPTFDFPLTKPELLSETPQHTYTHTDAAVVPAPNLHSVPASNDSASEQEAPPAPPLNIEPVSGQRHRSSASPKPPEPQSTGSSPKPATTPTSKLRRSHRTRKPPDRLNYNGKEM